MANNGVVFANVYCTAPSCAPSRASILNGRNAWQMQQGDLLYGSLPEQYAVFTQLLQENGYYTGMTGKGYAPANYNLEGFHSHPVGKSYIVNYYEQQHKGISNINYAKSFQTFLQQKPVDQPFFFWFGASEPHRIYKNGIGREQGKSRSNINVPGFMPDHEVVRNDMADYFH